MCTQNLASDVTSSQPHIYTFSDEILFDFFGRLKARQLLPLLRVSSKFRGIAGDVHLLKAEFEFAQKWNERLKLIVEDNLRIFGRAAATSLFLKGWTEFKKTDFIDLNNWQSLAQTVQIFRQGLHEITLDDLSIINTADIPHGNADLLPPMIESSINCHEMKRKIIEKIEMADKDRGVLSFGMRKMTDERCKLFLELLAKRTEIATITVDSELTDNQLKMLADSLDPTVTSQPLPIKNFVLNMEREIPLENLSQIITAVARNPSIRSLRFGEYYLSDQSLETMSAKLQDLTNVNSLSIKHCVFTPETIQRLMAIITRTPNLLELSLNGCNKEALREIFRTLNSSHLTSISLTNCPVDDDR